MWPLPRASDMTAPAGPGEAIATEEVVMVYSVGAVERAMTIHQALRHALHGRQTWLQVADVIGLSPRSVRRWRARLEQFEVPRLLDRRHQTPSPRRVPLSELQRVLRLYRERYPSFNVRHFHQLSRRDHVVTFSYTLFKTALHEAGLVAKSRARGRHPRRREPRPCFGELLHLDGSRHRWLALVPDAWHTRLLVVDDATKQLLYAHLLEGGESTRAIMQALWTVFERSVLLFFFYTDRAHWAVHTPTSGSAPDARALPRSAARGMPSASNISWATRRRPAAAASGPIAPSKPPRERAPARRDPHSSSAHRYVVERFLPAFNATFVRPPAYPAASFVPVTPAQL